MTTEDRKKLMRFGQWMSSDIIHAYLRVCSLKYGSIKFFSPYRAVPNKLEIKEKFIAIINTDMTRRGSHWICISNINERVEENGCIRIGYYNSIDSTTIPKDVLNYISVLYGRRPIKLIIYSAELQEDAWSCGLHALGNATDLLCNVSPLLRKLNIEESINHVRNSLEQKDISPFPKTLELKCYWKENEVMTCENGAVIRNIVNINM